MRKYKKWSKGDVIDTIEGLGYYCKAHKNRHADEVCRQIKSTQGPGWTPQGRIILQNDTFDIIIDLRVRREE